MSHVTPDDVLLELGLRLGDYGSEAVHAAALRIARRIAAEPVRRVGFFAADDAVGTSAVLLQLGLAYGELTGRPCAIIDANPGAPGLAAIANVAEEGDAFAIRWLRDTLAVITPTDIAAPRDWMPRLDDILESGVDPFSLCLVDLTGFESVGEHLAAGHRMDRVVVLARSGVATADALGRWSTAFPKALFWGVVLVG